MEEIEMLKQRIAELEAAGRERGEVVREVVKEHLEKPPEQVIESPRLPQEEIKKHAERVADLGKGEEGHQRQVLELMQLAQDRGIVNAVSVVRHLDDPHMEDDFHAALIKFFQNV